MMDDYQESFGLTLIQLGYSANTTDTAEMDAALAKLKEQKPLVRTYSNDTVGVMTGGDVWIGMIWGSDLYQISQENENVAYFIPEEGGVRGSDTMAIYSGAQHPIAAHLFINHMLDAEVSAANTNFIGYMGPNAAAKEFIDPAILADPAVNPDVAILEKLEELLDLPNAVDDEYLNRWQELRAAADRGRRRTGRRGRRDGPSRSTTRRRRRGRAPRRGPGAPLAGLRGSALVLPGVAWLALFFVVPLAFIFVVSLGTRNELHQIVLDEPVARQLPAGLRPDLPADDRHVALLRDRDDDPVARHRASRSPTGSRATAGGTRSLLLLLMMLPFWTSYLIRTYAWMIILRDQGVVNALLQAVGLTSEPIVLLNTDFSVILGMTYGFLPFAILPLFVSIDRLDPNLVAAARDLYASGRQAFVHVTLPLVMPGLIAAALLTFIPALGDFVTPDLLGGAQVTTIAKVIQERFLDGRDWPYGAALGFVLMLVTLVGTFVALRTLRREVVGAQ